MTLNGHFALKSVSGSAMGWHLRISDKTVRTFAQLPIHCRRQKCSPRNVVSDSIRFMQIFAGVPCGGASLRQMRVWSLKMAIFASFVHCLPNILHTWLYDSFHVMRLSMTLVIFQGRWTVSHQISQKRCVIRQKLL